MRKRLFILVIGMALAACSTAAPATDNAPPAAPTGTPVVESESPTSVPIEPTTDVSQDETEIETQPETPVPTQTAVQPTLEPSVEPTPTGTSEASSEEQDNIYCAGSARHPVGESIAQKYDVTYEEVMNLFCSGFTFDNILLALETSQQTDDYSPRELLHMKQTMSWDDIWAETGIIDHN